jgi:transcriptional regulator with XRE-family HTH domain
MDKKVTPEQSRAARGLLNWSQGDLAKKVRMGTASISDFERNATNPYKKNMEDIGEAFKEAGIIFEDNENEIVVRLVKTESKKK